MADPPVDALPARVADVDTDARTTLADGSLEEAPLAPVPTQPTVTAMAGPPHEPPGVEPMEGVEAHEPTTTIDGAAPPAGPPAPSPVHEIERPATEAAWVASYGGEYFETNRPSVWRGLCLAQQAYDSGGCCWTIWPPERIGAAWNWAANAVGRPEAPPKFRTAHLYEVIKGPAVHYTDIEWDPARNMGRNRCARGVRRLEVTAGV